MSLLQKALDRLRPVARRNQFASSTGKRLKFESLERREVFSVDTIPFVIVNNSTINTAGDLAFQDDEVYIAIYGQQYDTDPNVTPPYYYWDASGTAHLTTTVEDVPTILLSSLTSTGNHTYTIDLQSVLPSGGQYGINSARMYFMMDAVQDSVPKFTVNDDAVGSVNAPNPNNSYFDFIEFSYNSPGNADNLNIDTTNVDQFGIPIQLNVNGTTVGTATTRHSVIDQFEAFTAGSGDPYAICIWPADGEYGTYRILNPSGVLAQDATENTLLQVQTPLKNGIDASQTTIHVDTVQAFPNPETDGAFYVQIDSEIMQVTNVTALGDGTNNWTVVPGQQSTTAAAHAKHTLFYAVDPFVSASQTWITVGNDEGYPDPASGHFNILVDQEIMTVTARQVNTDGSVNWTVQRGQDNTTATTHSSGATAYWSSVTGLGLNSIFNEAIDNLFKQYDAATTSDKLLIQSNADGTTRVYEGNVVPDGENGAYVMRFTIQGDQNSPDFDVYYPFFTDNKYYWAGYTPEFATQDAPSWAAAADLTGMSPSTMVFQCDGVFADNKERTPYTTLTADQLKVLADLENQMVSALNRGVGLLQGYSTSGTDNTWADTSLYYQNNTDGQVWNRYAEFVHKDTVSIDGLNYGFAFDDQDGQASDISTDTFSNVHVALGPWALHDTPGPGPGPGPNPIAGEISQRRFINTRLAEDHSVGPHSAEPHAQSFALSGPEVSPLAIDAALSEDLASEATAEPLVGADYEDDQDAAAQLLVTTPQMMDDAFSDEHNHF